jgi:Flp pilus assembly protein TadG
VGLVSRDERGFVTLWLMCCAFIVLLVIFMVADAWQIIAVDRDLSAAVDGAAAAGANGIDEQAFRDSGIVQLDPGRAEALATDNLSTQPHADQMVGVSISATAERITVTAERPVQLLLLRIIGDSGRTVHAGAEATPRRSP